MDGKKKDIGLIIAIIFASAVISGSLVFFGLQVAGKGGGCDVSVDKIKQAIKEFNDEQTNQQQVQVQQQQDQEDKNSEELAKRNLKPVTSADHVRGNKNAKITMITYSDFECPYCKKFHPIAKQIFAAYGDKINWVYRHYPLDFHDPMATKEAVSSECVAELGGNDAFWNYVDMIYDKTKSGGNGLTEDNLISFAGAVGVNQLSFKTCLSSGKYDAIIKQEIIDGEKSGVKGTPGNIFVNNGNGDVSVLNGAQKLDNFKKLIDKMLNIK
jgi:protein-disulfide isomerase